MKIISYLKPVKISYLIIEHFNELSKINQQIFAQFEYITRVQNEISS